MSKERKNNLFSLIFNAVILVCNTFATIYCLVAGLGGNMEGNKLEMFRYFTIDSNILVAICSGILLYHNIKKYLNENYQIPYYAYVLKYVGATSVFLTFMIAICFLSFFYGFIPMIAGVNFILHVSSPILAFVSAMFFEQGLTKFKHTFYCCIPQFVYGVIYLVCVAFLFVWPDFYNLTFGGHFEFVPLVFVGMVGINYGLGYLIYFANKKVNKVAK